jgi:hypothetical protein
LWNMVFFAKQNRWKSAFYESLNFRIQKRIFKVRGI